MSSVLDVTLADFEQLVIHASVERPVVAFFWASWSAPCKALGETLEKLSAELGFVLARVDVESPENQQLAAYLRIQSLPDTRVFALGQIADVIPGAPSEQQLRKRLAKFFLSEEDQQRLAAEEALASGNAGEALQVFQQLAQANPSDHRLRYLCAKSLVALGKGPEALALLKTFAEGDDFYSEARSLVELMDFHAEAARTDAVTGEAASYRQACKLAAEGAYREALEAFLLLVSERPSQSDSPARKAMLTLFGVLGAKHELTWEFRARLNTLVFI